jgi:SAM-dependent methyltransferase
MQTSYGKAFSVRGDRYERSMTRSPDVRREEFATMLDWLRPQPGEHIVDSPSGGAYLRPYLPLDLRYTAVDESPEFQAACSRRIVRRDAAIMAPCQEIPLPSGSCDAICSLAGLHHLHDRAPVYAEWHRLLRPGGRVVLADVAAGNPVGAFLNGFVDRYNTQGHDGRFLDAADESALSSAGFGEVTRVDVNYHWNFRDLGQVESFCADLFGLDRVGAGSALRRVLQADLGLHCHQGSDRGDGGRGEWRLPWSLRYLIAEKGCG